MKSFCDKTYKGAVLAAGFGTRLKPLTLTWPKPLIPIFGSHPLELALHILAKHQISEVAVNGHYLAERVSDYLKQQTHIENYQFFQESQILGTGGVYNPMRPWLSGADLIVINGDVLIDIDLREMIKTHENTGADATMALLPRAVAAETRVYFDGQCVRGFSKQDHAQYSNHCFALVQILTPRFLDLLPKEGSFDIVSKGYQVALEKGYKVTGYVHKGYWRDIGSPAALLDTVRELLNDPGLVTRLGLPACWQQNGFEGFLTSSASQHSTTLCERGCKLGDDLSLGPHVYIAQESKIGSHSKLSNCLVLPGAILPSQSRYSNVICTSDYAISV